MNFIILSSSKGTTMQAVLDAIQDGSLSANCLGLISDNEDRGCVEKARNAGIPIVIVEKKTGEEREMYDKRLNKAIDDLTQQFRIQNSEFRIFIACLGWMYIFSPWFVQQWQNCILNVHPSLLPKHPGRHAIQDALNAKDTETGMTIHIIDKGVDTGPIIVQKSCSILEDDTEETLRTRVQELEKEWYPKVLQDIHKGEIQL